MLRKENMMAAATAKAEKSYEAEKARTEALEKDMANQTKLAEEAMAKVHELETQLTAEKARASALEKDMAERSKARELEK